MLTHDPKVQVAANLAEAEELIRRLRAKLDDYRQMDKVYWGHASELGHINYTLRQLLREEA